MPRTVLPVASRRRSSRWTRRRARGRARRWGALLPLTVVLAGLQLVASPPASAASVPDDTGITVARDDLRAALIAAIEAPRFLHGDSRCEALVLEAALLERYDRAVSATPTQVVAQLRAVADAYAAQRGTRPCARGSVNEGVLDLVDFGVAWPSTQADTRQALLRVAELVLPLTSADGNGVGDRGLTVSIDSTDHLLATRLAPQDLARRAVEEAAADPAYAQARDELLGEETGVSMTDSVSQLAAHPTLDGTPIEQLATAADAATGVLTTTFGAVMAVVEDAEQALDDARDDALDRLVAMDAGEQTPKQVQDAVELRLPETAVAVGGHLFAAVVLVAGTVAGGAAAGVKAAVQGVGQLVKAGMALAGTARTILKAVIAAAKAGLGKLVKNGALVRLFAQLTRNVSWWSMVLPANLSATDQRVLAAIDAVREDIAQLRAEMHERFDAIDAKLDTIYAEMVSRFDELSDRLANLESGIETLRGDLVRIAAQVERLERNLYGLFRDSQNRELWTQINTAIGWRERSVDGTPMSNDQFLTFEGFFYTWLTLSAYDEIATGPAVRAYDDASIERELTTVPLEGNLSYLSHLGTARLGLPALANGPLPNLRDYAVAARAYSALLVENPEYLTPGVRQRAEEIHARGEAVLAALDKLRAVDDPGVDTGSKAVNGALATYRAAATTGAGSVAASLQSLESDHLAGLLTPRGNVLGIDPWGATDQASPLDTDVPQTVGVCGDTSPIGGGFGLDTPSTMSRTAAYSALMRNAMRLGGVNGRVVCEVTATDRRSIGGIGSFKDHTADFTVEFRTEYKRVDLPIAPWATALSKKITFDDVLWCEGTDEDCATLDAMEVADENWPAGTFGAGNWKAQFENSATTQVSGSVTLANVVKTRLTEVQRGVYQHLLSKVDEAPLQPALSRLTGAKRLLEAYAEMSLPRAMQDGGTLHGTLYGADPLPAEGGDDTTVSATLAAAAASPPAQNARLALVALIDARAAELQEALTASIGAAAPAASPARALETPPLLAATLDRLRLSSSLADLDAGTGGGDDGGDDGTAPPPVIGPAPQLSSASAKAPKLGKLPKKPIVVRVASTTGGTLSASLTITKKAADAAGLGRLRELAKGQAAVRPGVVQLKLRVPKKAAKKLAKLTRRLKTSVTLTLTGPDGRPAAPVQVRLTLKP